jgi:hypothetical protein
VLRRDWMFKLVGTETFSVGKSKAACSIKIEPVGGFSYEYSLEVSTRRIRCCIRINGSRVSR